MSSSSSNDTGLWEHSVFKSVAEGVVRAKLAQDVEEAYTLIIPAFAEYNLLPTEPSLQDGTASGEQEATARTASSEGPTMQDSEDRHSSPSQDPLASRQDSILQQSSTKQVATIHQEPSHEQVSPIHRYTSQQSQVSEPSAAQPSEETSSPLTEQ